MNEKNDYDLNVDIGAVECSVNYGSGDEVVQALMK